VDESLNKYAESSSDLSSSNEKTYKNVVTHWPKLSNDPISWNDSKLLVLLQW
jgi:hypothetical protein